MKFNVKFH